MDLKTVLFEKARTALGNLIREKALFPGENHELSRRTFCAIWDVIVSAGLEEEYLAWEENL